MNKTLAAVAAAVLGGALAASGAWAADERARRDINQVPSLLAVSSGSVQELRNIRSTQDGFLMVVSTGVANPITGTVTANQGTAAAASGAWPTKLTDGTDTADVTAASALKVDGSAVTQPVSDAGGSLTVDAVDLDIRNLASGQDSVAAVQSGAWSVTILNAAGASAVNVQDGGNSLTVDGTVAATQSGSWTVGSVQSGGPYTVTAGTGTFLVGDGAGALTVDGTVAATQSGAWSATLLVGTANIGTVSGSTVSVTNLSGGSLAVNDAGGSLTIDGTVAATQAGVWSVTASQSGSYTVTPGTGTFTVGDGGSSLTVDAVDLDVRNLVFATDKADVSGSTIVVRNGAGADAVNVQDGGNSLTVDDGGGSITVDGTITSSPGAWTTSVVSTGACGAAATLAIVTNASAKTSTFCNEGTDAVRVGPAGVTATVGLKVLGSTCVPLDGPVTAFQGALFCIRTTGADQAFSTMQGQ